MANLQRKNVGIAVLMLSIACFLIVLVLSGVRSGFLARQVQVQRQEQSSFAESSRLVFFGTSGVSWDLLTAYTAPNLYAAALSEHVKAANFVVKVKADTACPDEGWLTLNTGVRTFGVAEGNQFCRSLPQISRSDDGNYWKIANWEAYLAANEDNKYDPQFGNLGRVSGLSEKKIAVIGAGAALALADTSGKLPSGADYFSNIGLSESIALSENAQIIFADLGSVREAASPLRDFKNPGGGETDPGARNASAASFMIPNPPTQQMRSDLGKLDADFASLVQLLKTQDFDFAKRTGEQRKTKIIFASLAESGRSGAKMQAYFEADLADLGSENLGWSDLERESGAVNIFGSVSREDEAARLSALAYTNSTRIPGVVQNTDLLPTIAMFTLGNMQDRQGVQDLRGERKAHDRESLQNDFSRELGNAVGAPITHYAQVKSPQSALAEITAQSERAKYARASIGYVFIGYSALSLTGLIASLVLLRFARGGGKLQGLITSGRISVFQFFLLSLGALPLASFLVNLLPWWDFRFPRVLFLFLILLFACVMGFAALRVPRVFRQQADEQFSAVNSRFAFAGIGSPRPVMAGVAIIALFTALTLTFDVATGSALQFSSIFGVQAQHAGRFYGFGNSAFVIFALSMLIVTAYGMFLMRRADAPSWQFFVFGLIMVSFAVYTDGVPVMGADFGGPPAIVLAFILLLMLNFGRTLRRRTLMLLLCFGLLAATGIAVFDWCNPKEERTHLGDFIQSVLDGDFFRVVSRKFGEMFTDIEPIVWVAVVFVVLLLFLILRRRGSLRRFALNTDLAFDGKILFPVNMLSCQVAIAALLCFALLINDSGLLLPFIGLIYALPLFCVIAVEGYFQDSAR